MKDSIKNNKQNFNSSKVPLTCFYSQQLKLPSNKITDQKSGSKSIQIKLKPSNKNKSRKYKCISAKQAYIGQTVQIHDLLKQFRKMKSIIEKQRSPLSSKSKSQSKNKKKLSFKDNSQNLKTNPSSKKMNSKISKTLKQLNQKLENKEQALSNIFSIHSSSDKYSLINQEKQDLFLQNQQSVDIFIQQIRYFTSQPKNFHKKKISIFKGDQYDLMARRIQRAWRKYITNKLIKQYTFKCQRQRYQIQNKQFQGAQKESLIYNSINKLIDSPKISSNEENLNQNEISHNKGKQKQCFMIENYQSQEQQNLAFDQRQDVMIQTQQFYHQEINKHKITHISNLQQQQESSEIQENSGRYEEALKSLKIQELAKWNDIITMISSHVANNPNQIQNLLNQLSKKSQHNKKDLQNKAIKLKQQYSTFLSPNIKQEKKLNSIIDKIQKQNMCAKFSNSNSKSPQKQKSDSSSSQFKKSQEFNSKKYIDYLDSDMYPISINNKQAICQNKTISLEQQQKLLISLKSHQSYPIRLGDPQLYKSESDKDLKNKRNLFQQQEKIKFRPFLGKSTSEKTIKKTIQSISPLQMNYDDQVNILQVDFQSSQPNNSLQNQHSQQALKLKFAQLIKLQEQQIGNKAQCIQEDRKNNFQKLKKQMPFQQKQQIKIFLNKVKIVNEFQLQQKTLNDFIQQQFDNKIQIQTINQNISSFQQQSNDLLNKSQTSSSFQSSFQINQRSEKVALKIFNDLIFQQLQQMAQKPETILEQFKKKSIQSKFKNKKNSKIINKKKGFKTNQTEIKTFVQGLISYLLHQQPHIFKNLQIATGPTAIQMLRYMHQTVQQQINFENQQEDDSNVMIIPNRIFDIFWQSKQKKVYQLNEIEKNQNVIDDREKQKLQFIKGLNKVFFRSLFDGFNQCLDYERNFGQFGRPFPWKKASVFDHNKSFDEIKKNIENAKKRMTDITTTYCGIIVQKEQMSDLCGNEGYLHQVQQDRLSRMLAQDLIQGQERWIFYDDEETQILVQLSSLISFELILQGVQQILKLKQ